MTSPLDLAREMIELADKASPSALWSSDSIPLSATDRAFIALARAGSPALAAAVVELTEAKDGAYPERDRLVAALSKCFPAWLERHPNADTSWDDDWRWIVFMALPTGQASWHIHDSELHWFEHLERRDGCSWDGHSTEEKYARLAALSGKASADE